jgi:hypothetical protein
MLNLFSRVFSAFTEIWLLEMVSKEKSCPFQKFRFFVVAVLLGPRYIAKVADFGMSRVTQSLNEVAATHSNIGEPLLHYALAQF